MSKIKFRAWDKNNKVWLNDNQFKISPRGEIETYGVYSQCEVMQYKERKDRKGKRICVGDIIKDNSGEIIIEAAYGDINKCIKAPTRATTDFLWEEIIGNIYEK